VCGLIHLDPADRLTRDAERAHYHTHNNGPGDPRYRAFLDRLAIPLLAILPPGAMGLDYGCGPGPTLSVMLHERGFPTADYDPFFVPNRALLDQQYDFVTCTETAEHFFDPLEEFTRIFGMLRPNGVLAVMTETVRASEPFESWRYARDPTHACFYRLTTLRWIAARFDRRVEMPERSVALFLPGAA
jgi:SAM-dependent methyltransferase